MYIVLEGCDGSGKDHFAVELKDAICQRYPEKKVTILREPGGTPQGEKMREILLTTKLNTETEAALLWASRVELLTHIRDNCKPDEIVIVTRNYTSTLVYQGILGGLAMSPAVTAQPSSLDSIIIPDIFVLLTIDPVAHKQNRPELEDTLDEKYMRDVDVVNSAYLEIVQGYIETDRYPRILRVDGHSEHTPAVSLISDMV